MDRNENEKSFGVPVAHRAIPALILYFVFGLSALLWQGFSRFSLPHWFQVYGLLAFVGILLVWLYSQGWRPLWRINRKTLFVCLIGFASYGLLLWGVDRALAGFGMEATSYHQYAKWSLLLQQLLLAPVIEELFFRDFLLRSFWQQMRGFARAAFFSSAFFMLAHFSLYPGAFLLGIVGALLVFLSRSIWPAILFHVLSNASLYFLPVLFPHLTQALHEWRLFELFFR